MEKIWVIYMENIYVGFKKFVGSCGYFVSGLIKSRPKNLYHNTRLSPLEVYFHRSLWLVILLIWIIKAGIWICLNLFSFLLSPEDMSGIRLSNRLRIGKYGQRLQMGYFQLGVLVRLHWTWIGMM